MKLEYTLIIYTPQELNHSSYVQTGLFELEQQGVIRVKVKLSAHTNLGRTIVSDTGEITKTKQANPKTSFYKLINNKDKTELFFAVDLYDFANQFSTEALEKCDCIFKRSYESSFVDSLPSHFKNKIYKMGLTFGVHSHFKKDASKFYWGIFLSNLKVNLKSDRFIFKRIRKTIKAQQNHWKFITSTRKLERFENYIFGKKNTILFQTRCFLSEQEKDVTEIHQQRYHLIKLLRKHFPKNFMGGFVPSKISKEKYGDALTNVPFEPEKYLDVLKSAKIVIYTRGLANSPAWKMAEYLSQGKVIIAEQLTTELPVPLKHEKEVLFFKTDEELISNINKVVADKKLATTLSKNARAYFEEYVHPTKNVKRILELMISESLD